MDVIKYLSVTTVMGAKLGEMIFLYVFLLAGLLLFIGVAHRKRQLSAVSYAMAMMDLLYFIVFFDMDMYQRISEAAQNESMQVFGCGVVTGLVSCVCLAGIGIISLAVRRFMKDKRYLL